MLNLVQKGREPVSLTVSTPIEDAMTPRAKDNPSDPTESSRVSGLAPRESTYGHLAAFCEKCGALYPAPVVSLTRDLEACLTFYAFPAAHWKTIRTTNVIERLFNEVKRRSHKMAAAFRSEDSCLLMFYAAVRSLKFGRITMPAEVGQPTLLHNS
jgi:hypothetical protein